MLDLLTKSSFNISLLFKLKCAAIFLLNIVHGLKYFLESLKVLYLVQSTWFQIIFGVPEGSILGPLLFNIFLADLFFIVNKIDIANYADDNTPYTSSNDVNGLIKSLEEASKELFKWFDDNLMKSNPDKCHLLVSTNDNVAIRIGKFQIENTKREKHLGIQFDNKLSFSTIIYQKYVKNILMNAFFKSQFSYYPLIWMCHSHHIINKK